MVTIKAMGLFKGARSGQTCGLAAAGQETGWQAAVINGCIRDAADIVDMDIAVKALASVPARGSRADPGEINVELNFLDSVFRPGEFLYSDEDGVILSTQALLGSELNLTGAGNEFFLDRGKRLRKFRP